MESYVDLLNHPRGSPERLDALCKIMQCPETREDLRAINCAYLKTEFSGRQWPLIRGIPNFLEFDPVVYPIEHISNAIAPDAQKLIDISDGLVLNMSAGGTTSPSNKVVEVEFGIFRNTDVLANVHKLPFRSCVFDAIICLNAFEHYMFPMEASRELFRVLKPNGTILIQTAFLQPVHEEPNHFFNCTEYGLSKWFAGFDEVEITVTENFNPVYSLSWIASLLEQGVSEINEQLAEQIGSFTLAQLSGFWRAPNQYATIAAAFHQIPIDLQRRMAAGYQLTGRRRDQS